MTPNRFQCPWCQKELELPPEAVRSKETKTKRREIEIVQITCPTCQRSVVMSRKRISNEPKQ